MFLTFTPLFLPPMSDPRIPSLLQPIAARALRFLARDPVAGRVTFRFDDGAAVTSDSGRPGPDAEIRIHSLIAIKKLFVGGYLGLAEGYLAGDWSTPSLSNIFAFGTANAQSLHRNLAGASGSRLINGFLHFLRRNTKTGSRQNIAYHYDLGNAFYKEWLDPSMTYSSACFDGPGQPLQDAQHGKYRRIIEALDIRPHHHVLEVGCGWGGFAEVAARETGASVTGITISEEQFAYAKARMDRGGLTDQVDIKFSDYRDMKGTFDRIVSIEMLEAVGERYWPDYFRMLADRLSAGGKAMVQVITVPDERFHRYRKSVDFIQRYIFPGGMLLSPGIIREQAERAGLLLADAQTFGQSYARTLDQWRERFLSRWPEIAEQGFDERFKRMWDYYLASTAEGFRAGVTDVGQYELVKP